MPAERGRENICFPVEEGLGKPWVSQAGNPDNLYKMKSKKIKVCVEKLSHFNCNYCKKWWSIGDTPKRKKWFCPWCGKEQ